MHKRKWLVRVHFCSINLNPWSLVCCNELQNLSGLIFKGNEKFTILPAPVQSHFFCSHPKELDRNRVGSSWSIWCQLAIAVRRIAIVFKSASGLSLESQSHSCNAMQCNAIQCKSFQHDKEIQVYLSHTLTTTFIFWNDSTTKTIPEQQTNQPFLTSRVPSEIKARISIPQRLKLHDRDWNTEKHTLCHLQAR